MFDLSWEYKQKYVSSEFIRSYSCTYRKNKITEPARCLVIFHAKSRVHTRTKSRQKDLIV